MCLLGNAKNTYKYVWDAFKIHTNPHKREQSPSLVDEMPLTAKVVNILHLPQIDSTSVYILLIHIYLECM